MAPVDHTWRSLSEIKIRVKGLPGVFHNTWQVYNLFRRYADIGYIKVEVFSNGSNARTSNNAMVIFR